MTIEIILTEKLQLIDQEEHNEEYAVLNVEGVKNTKQFFKEGFFNGNRHVECVSDHLKKIFHVASSQFSRSNSVLQNKLFTLPEKAIEFFRHFRLLKNFLPRKLSSTQTLMLNYLYSIDASFTLTLKPN